MHIFISPISPDSETFTNTMYEYMVPLNTSGKNYGICIFFFSEKFQNGGVRLHRPKRASAVSVFISERNELTQTNKFTQQTHTTNNKEVSTT